MDLYNRRSFLHFDVPAAERSPRARRRATSDCDVCESDRDLIAQARWDDFSTRTPSTSTCAPRTPTYARNSRNGSSSTDQIQTPRGEKTAQSGEDAASDDVARQESSFTDRQLRHGAKNLGGCSNRKQSNGNPLMVRRVRRNLPTVIPSETARAYSLAAQWSHGPWRLSLGTMGCANELPGISTLAIGYANAPHGTPTFALGYANAAQGLSTLELGQQGIEVHTPATGSTCLRVAKDVSEQQQKEDVWVKRNRKEEKKEDERKDKDTEEDAAQREEPARKLRKTRKTKKGRSALNGQTQKNSAPLTEECRKDSASRNREARLESTATKQEEQAVTPTSSGCREERESARQKGAKQESSDVDNRRKSNDIAVHGTDAKKHDTSQETIAETDRNVRRDVTLNPKSVKEKDIVQKADGTKNKEQGKDIVSHTTCAIGQQCKDVRRKAWVEKDKIVNGKQEEKDGTLSLMNGEERKDVVQQDTDKKNTDIALDLSGVRNKEQGKKATQQHTRVVEKRKKRAAPKGRTANGKAIRPENSCVTDNVRGQGVTLPKSGRATNKKHRKDVVKDSRMKEKEDSTQVASASAGKKHEDFTPKDSGVKENGIGLEFTCVQNGVRQANATHGGRSVKEKEIPLECSRVKDLAPETHAVPKDERADEKIIALETSGVMDKEREQCTAPTDSKVPEKKQTNTVVRNTRSVKERGATQVVPEDRNVRDALVKGSKAKKLPSRSCVAYYERYILHDLFDAKNQENIGASRVRNAQNGDATFRVTGLRGDNALQESASTQDCTKDFDSHAEPEDRNVKEIPDVVRNVTQVSAPQHSAVRTKKSWYQHSAQRQHSPNRQLQRVPATVRSLRPMDPLPLKNSNHLTCVIDDAHTPLSDTHTLHTVPTPSISRCGDLSMTKKVSYYDERKGTSLYTRIAATNSGPNLGVDIGRDSAGIPRRNRKPRRRQECSFYPVGDNISFYVGSPYRVSKHSSAVSSSVSAAWQKLAFTSES